MNVDTGKRLEEAIRRSWEYIADEVVYEHGPIDGEEARFMALDRVTLLGGLSDEDKKKFWEIPHEKKVELAERAMPEGRWVY